MTRPTTRTTTSAVRDDCVSASALTRRGWTRVAIRRFLGEPDRTAPNPFYRQATPMRLYSLTRAVAAEDTQQWRRWRTQADQTLRPRQNRRRPQTRLADRRDRQPSRHRPGPPTGPASRTGRRP